MLEIGTGMGNFFANYAENNPEIWCIGIELKFKRLYRTYEKCAQKWRWDVILLRVMGQEIVNIFESDELDEMYLLFSDPWPKKAHHKHRVIQAKFLQDAHSVLKKNWLLIIKTDDESYAQWIDEYLKESAVFEYEKISDEDPEKRSHPENATEFETIWRNQWKKITSFYCKNM